MGPKSESGNKSYQKDKHMKHCKILTLLILSMFYNSCGEKIKTEEKSPVTDKVNFILIYTDDHGYSDLSAQGIKDDIKTPNIDQLALGGVRMESGYATAPQCVPSRAGVLTGVFQSKFGVEKNGDPLTGFNEQLTIAEKLKANGYTTGMAGKWHLGPADEITEHGFDWVFNKAFIKGNANFDVNGYRHAFGPETSGMYHIDACSAAASAFIDKNSESPFFLYLAYRAPHVPLDATEKYLSRFPGEMPERRRQALAMLSAVDDGVGEIMKTLEANGIVENTIIFFIGDNGAPLKITREDKPGGGPGWDGSLNDPLNGEKGTLIEGGMRTPYIVYWKDKLQKGTVYKHPVSSLDFAATANVLAGLPKDNKLDGVNLIPYLNGELKGAPHDKLCWRWWAQSAIRKGKWKYLNGGDREYLFDLEDDIEEKKDVFKNHPEIASQLKTELSDWCKDLSPPGLQNGKMSKNATKYFDFYLDGIPYSNKR